MDDADEVETTGGIDGVDSFLRSLPEILVSVIIIIVAYFVWRFFNSEVGQALSATTTELVASLSDMLSNWRLFLLGFVAVKVLVPWGGSVAGFLATRVEQARFQRDSRMLNNDEMLRRVQQARDKLAHRIDGAYQYLQEREKLSYAESKRIIHTAVNSEVPTMRTLRESFPTLSERALKSMWMLAAESSEDAARLLQAVKEDPSIGDPPLNMVARSVEYEQVRRDPDSAQMQEYGAAARVYDVLQAEGVSTETRAAIRNGLADKADVILPEVADTTIADGGGTSWGISADGDASKRPRR